MLQRTQLRPGKVKEAVNGNTVQQVTTKSLAVYPTWVLYCIVTSQDSRS